MDWSDIASSTGFQLGYPLLSALVSATGPRGANIAQGLNTGMAITNRYAEQRKADEENKILSQKIGDVFKSITPVSSTSTVASMPVNPQTASFSMPSAPDDQGTPVAPVPLEQQTTVSQKPVFSPQMQKLGEALAVSRNPSAALGIAERALTAKQQPMQHFGSPETGYYGVAPGETTATQLVPGVGRRPATLPRPVVSEYGTMIPIKDPTTGEITWPSAPTPALSAPARQLSPEQSALEAAKLRTEQQRPGLIGAQTGAANASASNSKAQAGAATARASRLNNLAKTAADPRATTGQASAAMNALIRERDSIETPEEDKPVINDAIRAVRSRLADIGKNPNGAQPAAAAPQPTAAPPGKPIGRTKDGKTVYQGADGKKYVAN